MTTFYIAAAGNDSNPGTQALPWKTIAKVNAASQSGNTYLFNGGDSFSDATLTVTASSVSFSSYGTGQATIHAPSGADVYIQNQGGINVTNLIFGGIGLELYNIASATQYSGFLFDSLTATSGLIDIETGNVGFTTPGSNGFANVTISNCRTEFIFISGNNTTPYFHSTFNILNNVVANGGTDGIDCWGVNGFTISGNVVHDCGTVQDNTAGISTEYSTNGTISSNEIYNQKIPSGGTSDGDGIDVDLGSSNVVVEYNYVHDCDGAGITLFQGSAGTLTYSGVTVRYNITQNNSKNTATNVPFELCLGSVGQIAMTGIAVYGNTFYSSIGVADHNAIVGFNASNITGTVANNIFYSGGNPRLVDAITYNPTTCVFAGNDYFGSSHFRWNNIAYTTFAAWQTATGQEKIGGSNVGLTVNPGLTNPGGGSTVNTGSYVTPALLAELSAYTLGPTSAMFHAGLNLTTNFSISPGAQDFYSNPINTASLSVGAASPINLGAVIETVVLGDYILQNGLNAFSTATNIEVCFAQPTTYLQAATTFNLGTAVDAGLFAAPVSAGNGQKVTSLAITNGSITAVGGGTASWFAVTDHVNSRFLAAIPLASPAVVGAGQAFSFQTTITIPAVAPVISNLVAASLAVGSPAFTSSPLNNKIGLIAISFAAPSPLFSAAGSGAVWQSLPVGAGGWLVGMDIAADGTMVVRTDTFGAFIGSTTLGTKWKQLYTTASMPANTAGFNSSGSFVNQFNGAFEVRIAPSNTNIIYMMINNAVYVSTNKGATFTATAAFAGSMAQGGVYQYRHNGQRMAVDPNNSSIVYVGTTNLGLFVTINAGTSWAAVSGVATASADGSSNFPGITGIVFDPASGTTGGATNTIYAASFGHGVYRSTNAGSSWSLLASSPAYVENAIVNSSNYFCAASTSSSGISADGQATTLQKFNGTSFSTLLTDSGQFIHDITVDPTNSSRLVVSSGGDPTGFIYQSLNGGSTWTGWLFGQAFVATDIPWLGNVASGTFLAASRMIFDPLVSGKIWASGGIGVWHTSSLTSSSTTGTTISWTSQNAGIEQMVVTKLISPPAGGCIVCVWDRQTFVIAPPAYPSLYSFESTSPNPVNAWDVDYAKSSPTTLADVTNGGFSGYSTNAGSTWTKYAGTFPPDGNSGGSIAASTATNFVYLGGGGPTNAYYTTNNGATWTAATGLPTSGWPANNADNMKVLAADGVTAGTFYLYNSIDGIYKSINNGASWTNVSSQTFGVEYLPVFVAVPGVVGNLFGSVGFSNSVHPTTSQLYRSINGGTTWTAVPNVADVWQIGFGAIAPSASYPTIYMIGWVSSVFGVWRSTDNATTWQFLIKWPANWADQPTSISGDGAVWNTCYIGYLGSSCVYGVNL